MNSVNMVILIGRLGKAPEVRQVGDMEVANLSIATQFSWYNKKLEKWQERTTWHKAVVWRPGNSLKDADAGAMVRVQGRYESSSWDDDQGVTHYKMEVIVDNWWVLPTGKGKFKTEEEKEADRIAKETKSEAEQDPFGEMDYRGGPDDILF